MKRRLLPHMVLAFAACIGPLACPTTVAQAAIPTHSATMTVSATVLPACNHTDCHDIPRVIRYEPASGAEGQPAFELTVTDGRRILTITY